MTPNEYQALAGRTECHQQASRDRMSGRKVVETIYTPNNHPDHLPVRVNHSIIGLAGEVGELASLLQKWIYYGKFATEEQKVELRKQLSLEYGDALWYIAEGLNALGLSMDQVMHDNIEKLKVRYPDKYHDYLAAEENRNREAEEQHVNKPTA